MCEGMDKGELDGEICRDGDRDRKIESDKDRDR